MIAIISIGLILIVTIIVIYYFFFRQSVRLLSNGFLINKIDSSSSSITPNNTIVVPKVNNSFTIQFGLYIDNFYMNHLRWKHLFHKGTQKTNLYDFKYWYNIESELPKQCIGVWLHPSEPKMRIAISTLLTYNHEVNEHPEADKLRRNLKPNEYKEIIETCDIDDIQPKTNDIYTIVVEGQTLSIYRNGKLVKTCGLKGEVMLNMGDMYFNYHKTYSGHLNNFLYIPKSFKPKKIVELYEAYKN